MSKNNIREEYPQQLPAPSGGPTWQEKMTVWYRNFTHRRTAAAYRDLSEAMKADNSFAVSWYANIAMAIYDDSKGAIPIEACNSAARTVMRRCFGVEHINPGERPAGVVLGTDDTGAL